MIYTSYFAKIKELEKNNIVPISICGKAPNWYKGLQYKKLAPKYDFFMKWKETKDNEYYIDCFKELVLSELNPRDVIRNLEGIVPYGTSDIALICYEKPEDFCHRHLVAEWFNSYGIACEEYNFNKEIEV